MKINEVERMVGITKKNIRFYEDEGLLKPKRQAENGYRNYEEDDIRTLFQIKLLRKLSVPIEEIRRLKEGSLTLSECLRIRVAALDREQEDLRQMSIFCRELAESGETFATMPTETLLSRMEEKEKDGVRFVNIKAMDKKRKKKIVSFLAAFLVVVFMVFIIALILYANSEEPLPLPLFIGILCVPLFVMGGVLLALRSRIKEIEKGEEDEAAHY